MLRYSDGFKVLCLVWTVIEKESKKMPMALRLLRRPMNITASLSRFMGGDSAEYKGGHENGFSDKGIHLRS